MLQCDRLRKDAEDGKVVFGINHEMRDFQSNRKKKLDLVIAQPSSEVHKNREFNTLVGHYGIELTRDQISLMSSIPSLQSGPVGSVRIALEAKACMTEHSKALPRLYDELNSSHLTIHGASDAALAVGFAMVNASDEFISPELNKRQDAQRGPVVTSHVQPAATERVLRKLEEIPRRTSVRREGFDAFGVVVVRLRNDGSPVEIVDEAPAPEPSDIFHYEQMILRLAQLYQARFS